MGSGMDLEFLQVSTIRCGLVVITKAIFKTGHVMGEVHTFGVMEAAMMENGSTETSTGEEHFSPATALAVLLHTGITGTLCLEP